MCTKTRPSAANAGVLIEKMWLYSPRSRSISSRLVVQTPDPVPAWMARTRPGRTATSTRPSASVAAVPVNPYPGCVQTGTPVAASRPSRSAPPYLSPAPTLSTTTPSATTAADAGAAGRRCCQASSPVAGSSAYTERAVVRTTWSSAITGRCTSGASARNAQGVVTISTAHHASARAARSALSTGLIRRGGARRGLGDYVGEPGPERFGQVVAHAVEDVQLGTGNGAGGGQPGADVDERILGAVNHRHRDPQATQCLRPVGGGEHGGQLPGHAGRVDAPVEGASRAGTHPLLVERIARRADHPKRLHQLLDVGRPLAGLSGQQCGQSSGTRPPDQPVARRGHDRRERRDQVGPPDREQLPDHAAE